MKVTMKYKAICKKKNKLTDKETKKGIMGENIEKINNVQS